MSFEKELVNKINDFRTNPREYAKKINEYISYFKGKILRKPGEESGIRTEEGASAYIDAVEFLSKQEGVEPLYPSKGLARICSDFMEEAQKVDPNDIGDIDLEGIISKYGSFTGSLNRAMDFGGEDPEQVLINSIVCDGDPNRGNRESLLSNDLKYIGVANSKHSIYRYCTFIISCTEFDNTYDSNDYGFLGGTPVEYRANRQQQNNEGEENNLIPQKDILNEKPRDEEPSEDEDEELPSMEVISETRSEKIIDERGTKKRVIKIIRTMKDGTKEIQTIKEKVEDD